MALTYDQRQKALGIISAKKTSAPVSREAGLAEIQAFKQQKLAERQAIEDAKETIPEKIANFTGGKELAQGGGQALASGNVNRLSEESLNRGLETQTKLINAIKEAREIGDTDIEARLKAQLKNIDFGQGIQEGFTNDMVSNREVIGSALQLGATAAGGYAGSKAIGATKALSPLKQLIAGGAAEGLVQGAGFGAGEEIKQEDSTLKSVAVEGLKGAGTGAVIGVAGAGVIGGAGKLATGVNRKLFPKGTLDEAIQKVTQTGSSELGKGSNKKLNKQVTDAIKLVDTSDVKTYDDAAKLFNDKASELTKAQDKHLSQFTQKLDNNAYTLRKTTKGGNSISKNYVDEAFANLEELYQKTNDIENLTDLQTLVNKANTEGLTVKEINDISRLYGSEFGKKAFRQGASGISEPVTSVTGESFEATRKGLKDTIRESTPDELSKQIDSEISDVIAAKDKFGVLADKVSTMKLKSAEVKGLGKIAKPILDMIDTLSFGFSKGVLQALRKESGIAGKSYMNILEAEQALSKRLKNVNKLIDQANNVTDEKGVKSILESKLFKTIFDTDGEFDKLKQTIKDTPNKQGGFVKNPLVKTDDLVEQAKKFDNVDEFIDNQNGYFHGTPFEGDIQKIRTGKGDAYFGKGVYLSGDKKVASEFVNNLSRTGNLEEVSSGVFQDINTGKIIKQGKGKIIKIYPSEKLNLKQMTEPEYSKLMEEFRKKDGSINLNEARESINKSFVSEGYDGLNVLPTKNFNERQVLIFNESVDKLKTKHELTEIFNKAKNTN